MFNSAVRTLKAHRIGPGARQGRVVNVKLKINRLSGFRAPTNEITHRVAPKSQKQEGYLLTAFLRLVIARAKRGPDYLPITGTAPRPPLPLFKGSMSPL